jgi:hypothetical protein
MSYVNKKICACLQLLQILYVYNFYLYNLFFMIHEVYEQNFVHRLCACFLFISYVKKICGHHFVFTSYESLYINFCIQICGVQIHVHKF